ncbi:adhesion regulating molecule 1 [Blomia tropicalis]|nr:adhesion regulating molecule 1 [Blomia tropicalis]
MSHPFFFGGSQSTQPQNQYLVQFKAGKLVKNGNLVTPIKDKKGLVYLHQSADDTLMHFCWKDRTTGQVEDDLIIFPDDAEFLKVSPMYYWTKGKEDKDEEYVSKINEYINNPPPPRASGGSGSGSGGGHSILSNSDLSLNHDDELRNLFNNSDMSTQQLMSMLGSVRGLGGASGLASLLGSVSGSGGTRGSSNRLGVSSSSSGSTPAAPQTPTTTPAVQSSSATSSESSSTTGESTSGRVLLSDLESIITNMSVGQESRSTGGSSEDGLNIDLSSSVNVDLLRPLLTDESFMKRVREMLPQIESNPPTETNKISSELVQTIQSPQFQQALGSFSAALQSGQLGPLVQQFGLPEECVQAANSGNLEAFVRGLEKKSTDSKNSSSSTGATPPKKDDDNMALD